MNNTLDDHVRAYEGDLQYDFDNQILLNWYPQRILEFIDKSSSLLELGLGHGYTTRLFSQHFSKHLVLEGSNAVIDNFRKKFPDCSSEIKRVFFEEFSGEEKFDVIVMGFILEHVDNPGGILNHFKRFLKKDGKIFVAVPNAEVLNRRIGHLAGMLPDMQELSENDFMLGHKRYYTVKSLTDDISKAGFNIERMEGIYLKPFTTQQMISLNFDKNVINALCRVGIEYPELSCGILAQLKMTQ
jgi:SAM-dependent methyltransferase